MKIRNIVGNPPFQNNLIRGKTQHKVWIKFTLDVFDKVLKDNGNLAWITPSSFSSPSNKVLELFRDYSVKYINFDSGTHFPDVGSTFAHYVINKSFSDEKTKVIKDGNNFNVDINASSFYLPNDFNDLAYSIHKKVIFDSDKKFDVRKDYVTCHNILYRTSDTLSKEKTDTHIYPVFHTNKQTWFSSVAQVFLGQKKVMWTRSGYTKPFYDNGKLGCTDMGYYIIVDSDEQGKNLESILNSKLFQYIFTTAKWSGFGNEKVFSSIPWVPSYRKLSDEELYEYFYLTNDEIEYINTFGLKKQHKKNPKVKKIIKSDSRVKEFGEVFTPMLLVHETLDKVPYDEYKNNRSFIDPSCGNGNFLVGVVEKKQACGIPNIDILKKLYGVDIMPDNVLEARNRILELVGKQKQYLDILDKNIVCHDAFTYDFSFKEKFWE